jgi:hypothetical protein
VVDSKFLILFLTNHDVGLNLMLTGRLRTISELLSLGLLSEVQNFESIGGACYLNNSNRILTDSQIRRESILTIDLKSK